MEKTINSDLMRGNIDTIILKTLSTGDHYGYEIIDEIKTKSRGEYILKEPTLYSCLKRLENQGFISSYWGSESKGGRRKYYSLTDMGREVFTNSKSEYEYSRTIIDQLISDRTYELEPITAANIIADQVIVQPTTAPENEVAASTQIEVVEEKEAAQPEQVVTTSEVQPAAEIKTDEIVVEGNIAIVTEEKPEPVRVNTSSMMDDILGSIEQTRESYTSNVQVTELPKNSGNDYKILSNDDTFTRYDDFLSNRYTVEYAGEQDKSTTPSYAEQPVFLPAEPEPVPEAPERSSLTSGFVKYNDKDVLQDIPSSSHTVTDYEYRKRLGSLIATPQPKATPVPQLVITQPEPQIAPEPKPEEPTQTENMSLRERIQIRNFGRLSQSIRDLGEEVKIRTTDNKSARDYNKQYYYYRNKLLLAQYAAIFAIMLIEALICLVIARAVVKTELLYVAGVYVSSVLIALALPIIAAVMFALDPWRKKRIDYSLKSSLIIRAIVMANVIIITYLINVYLGMPIGGSKAYAISLLLPIILSTNIPLSSLIFQALHRIDAFKCK